MKKLLIIIALLSSAKGFAQSESDRLKEGFSDILDNPQDSAEVLIIDQYGTVFGLDDHSNSVCGNQYYAKIVEYPYGSQGKVLGCETKASILEKIGNRTYRQAAISHSKLNGLYNSNYHFLPVTGLKDKFGDLFYSLSPDFCEQYHIKNPCGDLWTKVLFPFDSINGKATVLGCESPTSILDNIYSGVYDDDKNLQDVNSAFYFGLDVGPQ
jgi:hypothetical protein